MKKRISSIIAVFVLLVTLLSQTAYASSTQTISFVTNGGKVTYCPGYVLAAGGYVKNGTVASRDTDVFIQILNSASSPVYYASTTTDENGYFMTAFTVPNDQETFPSGSYTVKASTAEATASQGITISTSTTATNSNSFLGAYPQGSTSISKASVIPVNTTTILLAFNTNVNYFINTKSGWSSVIIGENENNEDCISVYQGTSSTPISTSVELVNDISAGKSAAYYYDSTGLYTSAIKQDCLLLTLNTALTSGTLYTVKIDGNLCANNGSKLGSDNYLYFQTASSAVSTSTASTTAVSTQTGEAIVKAAVDSNGKAAATFTADQMTSAITDAVAKATAQSSGTKSAVKITVDTSANPKAVDASIPSSSMDQLVSSGVQSMTVKSSLASITFDKISLGTMAAGSSDVTVSAKAVDVSTLSGDAQKAVGARPVYNFSVTSGGTAISKFGGNVSISIPYTPATGENASAIIVYYIKADGTLESIPVSYYDTSTGTVSFTTTHFSTYAVGYNSVSFSDVSGWCSDYVGYLSARGIISGTGSSTFDPNSCITRASFVTILANLSGADLSVYKTSAFGDVKTSDWYFHSVQWAAANGIVLGTDGKFNPNSGITRQDMAVILTRYAASFGYQVPSTLALVTLTDNTDISAYATASVKTMQQAGVISGYSDGSFKPLASATRAEAAKMVAVFVKALIG